MGSAVGLLGRGTGSRLTCWPLSLGPPGCVSRWHEEERTPLEDALPRKDLMRVLGFFCQKMHTLIFSRSLSLPHAHTHTISWDTQTVWNPSLSPLLKILKFAVSRQSSENHYSPSAKINSVLKQPFHFPTG